MHSTFVAITIAAIVSGVYATVNQSQLYQRNHIQNLPTWWSHGQTVDGRNPAPVNVVNVPVFIGSEGFIHFRWCRISSINSIWCLVTLLNWIRTYSEAKRGAVDTSFDKSL